MKRFSMIAATTLIALMATGATAQTWDPTQSKLYKATPWVEPLYRGLDSAQRIAPHVAPKNLKPQTYAFRGGWEVGKAIEKRFDLGGKLYNRFMANPPRR